MTEKTIKTVFVILSLEEHAQAKALKGLKTWRDVLLLGFEKLGEDASNEQN